MDLFFQLDKYFLSPGAAQVTVAAAEAPGKKGKGWMASPAAWLKGEGKKKKEEEVTPPNHLRPSFPPPPPLQLLLYLLHLLLQVAKAPAKGTGYSSYSHKGWDIKAYQAAQKEKDKQIQVPPTWPCSPSNLAFPLPSLSICP